MNGAIIYNILSKKHLSVNDRFNSVSTWAKFEERINASECKGVVLCGLTDMAYAFISEYGKKYNIVAIADNNSTLHFSRLNGVKVVSYDKFYRDNVAYIITSVNRAKEIRDQLLYLGVNDDSIFVLTDMESKRFSAKISIFMASSFPGYYKRIFRDKEIADLKVRSLIQAVSISRLNGYLKHTNNVLNCVINETIDDDEVKLEQIRYGYVAKHVHHMSEIPNLDEPHTFNEKLLRRYIEWDKNPLYSEIVDKYEFKKYVARVVGKEYVVPVLGVWNSPYEIDFDNLPKSFCIKATNGGDSREVMLVDDKDKLNIDELRKKMIPWTKKYRSVYYYNFDGGYRNIPMRIMAEQLIGDSEHLVRNYKFHMFKGDIKGIDFIIIRDSDKETLMGCCDENWNPVIRRVDHKLIDKENIRKPVHLEEMISIAKKLSEPFDYIRVDFMENDEEFYVGEMTLAPCGGMGTYITRDFELEWGSWMD